ncbi:MAG: hypothetical protein JWM68_4734 [Verrucomicrobiales bacterium]|nr:hypothetical protein [Verrucomicrobiales bacterium]
MKYKLVRIAENVHSIHSVEHGETFHPVIGPAAEAEALYVEQLRLRQRLEAHTGDFIVWDIGLGAAANAVTVLRATQHIPCSLKLFSFEHTLDPLRFSLEHASTLKYLEGYEAPIQNVLDQHRAQFKNGAQQVDWRLMLGDFPTLLEQLNEKTSPLEKIPAPHAILFDPFSPAKNPGMWTPLVFQNLFRCLTPEHPCALATYSRSTFVRISLLLGGFFVGVGHATGEKEETTKAANTLSLLEEPLDLKWLWRVLKSGSAEPMWDGVYRQSALKVETWEKLKKHPQFFH